MDDISQLRSRVEAAQKRLTSAVEEQQKYGLRLDDVARIVEGSLSRQRGELEAARNKAAALQAECDTARGKAATLQAEYDAAETRLSQIELRSTALAAQSLQLAAQNEQLRGMVMTLLQLVEGRNTVPLNDTLQRIEVGLRGFLAEQPVVVPPAPAPVAAPTLTVSTVTVSAPAASVTAPTVTPTVAAKAVEEDLLLDINAEPDADIAGVVAEPAPDTSPVAELIRRISEETEEIAPPSQRKA